MLTIQETADLIPQKTPFVMIGRLMSSDDVTTVTTLAIEGDNVLVEDGYLSEAGLIENIAQTAAAKAGYHAHRIGRPVQTGYIGAIKDLKINNLPPIGAEISTKVTVINQVFDVTIIKGEVSLNNTVIAGCEMKIFVQPEVVEA